MSSFSFQDEILMNLHIPAADHTLIHCPGPIYGGRGGKREAFLQNLPAFPPNITFCMHYAFRMNQNDNILYIYYIYYISTYFLWWSLII